MALPETLIFGASIGLCLLLAWAIGVRGAVGLVAGYDGGLPPAKEAELARDAAGILLAAAAGIGILVVDAWTGAVPRAGAITTLAVGVPVGWFLWKWNVRDSESTPTR